MSVIFSKTIFAKLLFLLLRKYFNQFTLVPFILAKFCSFRSKVLFSSKLGSAHPFSLAKAVLYFAKATMKFSHFADMLLVPLITQNHLKVINFAKHKVSLLPLLLH